MKTFPSALLIISILQGGQAFAPGGISQAYLWKSTAFKALLADDLMASLDRQVDYQAGAADTEFARKYRHLVGRHVRTTGEAFADFTSRLGRPIQALYKGAITDLVGTTHLITVDARFKRDAIWSLGLIESLDLILKNYPEGSDVANDIITSLLQSVGLEEADVRFEADLLKHWCQGKSQSDIATALKGEGESIMADIARSAKVRY
jgi:hypothetical protein